MHLCYNFLLYKKSCVHFDSLSQSWNYFEISNDYAGWSLFQRWWKVFFNFFLEFIILSNFLAIEECFFWDDMQLRSTNPPKLTKNHVINICENRTTFRFSQGDITWGNFNCSLSKLPLAFVVKYFVTILIKIHKNINEFI